MFMDKKQTDESRLVELISGMADKLSVSQKHDLINHIKFVSKGEEKRGTKRKAVKVSVDYAVKDRIYTDMLVNISAGGAFIITNRLFQAGYSTTMVVSFPNMERCVKIKGKIVRLTDEGFGVKFIEENHHILSSSYPAFFAVAE